MTRSSSSSSIGISIHALHEEGDSLWLSSGKAQKHFYPRPPRGGRRRASGSSTRGGRFLSTPSARRATDELHGDNSPEQFLSTPSARRATKPNQEDRWNTV